MMDDYKRVWQYVGWQKTYQGIKVCLTCVSGGNNKGQCAMKETIGRMKINRAKRVM
jgi:hypothetical protein